MADCRATSLLHKVQMARIFADSKTFVDMTIKRADLTPNDIVRSGIFFFGPKTKSNNMAC